MTPGHSLLRLTWAELRRRQVVRAGITYGITAWIILQAAEITFEPLGLPPWAMTWTVLAAVLGFPIVLVLSWFFDVSRRGVRRERGKAGAAGAAFAVAIVLLAVAGSAWWLYGVYAPSRQVTTADESTSTAPPNSVGVLPFDDLSPGKDQGFLADGIAEELLDRLARNSGLRVAARTSSFALRGQTADVRELGRRLNVRWILEGSLRKDAGRVRVTAQLIDAGNGFHVWTDTYERPDKDLFALQDEVAGAIATALSTRIRGVSAEAPSQADTQHPEALQAYLHGRQSWRLRTPASLEQAETLFKRAVELDAGFARAWSGLADTYLLQADYGNRPLDEAIGLAEQAAVQAVGLRPQLGEAWASLGLLRMTIGQFDAAQRSFEEAMRLDPRYEMAPMWLASLYGRVGDPKKQREVLLKALELNPLEPVINSNLALLLATNGQIDEARQQLQRVSAIVPREAILLRGLAEIERIAGRWPEALRAAQGALDIDAEAPTNLELMISLLLSIEDFERAEALAHKLPADSDQRLNALQNIALVRGDTELQQALATRIAGIAEQPATRADRNLLTLGGYVKLRAGHTTEAIAWLQRAVGEPAEIKHDINLLDAASLLAVAHEHAGNADDARRWREAVTEAATELQQRAGNSPRLYLPQLLLAQMSGNPEALVAELEAAYAKGFRDRWRLQYDPRVASVRNDPRVIAIDTRLATTFAQARTQSR